MSVNNVFSFKNPVFMAIVFMAVFIFGGAGYYLYQSNAAVLPTKTGSYIPEPEAMPNFANVTLGHKHNAWVFVRNLLMQVNSKGGDLTTGKTNDQLRTYDSDLQQMIKIFGADYLRRYPLTPVSMLSCFNKGLICINTAQNDWKLLVSEYDNLVLNSKFSKYLLAPVASSTQNVTNGNLTVNATCKHIGSKMVFLNIHSAMTSSTSVVTRNCTTTGQKVSITSSNTADRKIMAIGDILRIREININTTIGLNHNSSNPLTNFAGVINPIQLINAQTPDAVLALKNFK